MLCLLWRPHDAAPTDDWGKNEYLEETDYRTDI